jgi:hypothetical protein
MNVYIRIVNKIHKYNNNRLTKNVDIYDLIKLYKNIIRKRLTKNQFFS